MRATWPDGQAQAVAVATCESHLGQDVATYDLEDENGGPMQLNRATWKPFFEAAPYHWPWERVVRDLATHFAAARIVFDRSSGWGPWSCYGG